MNKNRRDFAVGLASASLLAVGKENAVMTDRERLQWILHVAKGLERALDLSARAEILNDLVRGIVWITVSSDEAVRNNKSELERIEALARSYERL